MRTIAGTKSDRGAIGGKRADGLVHLVKTATVDWTKWDSPRPVLHLSCSKTPQGSSRSRGVLLDPATDITCRKCQQTQRAVALGHVYEGEQYTYYARREADGFIKIGVSIHPGARCAHLGLELLAVELSVYTASEDARHSLFAADRRDGEYFVPSPDLLAHVESLAAHRGDTLKSHGHELARTKYQAKGLWWPGDPTIDERILDGRARAAWRCGVAS